MAHEREREKKKKNNNNFLLNISDFYHSITYNTTHKFLITSEGRVEKKKKTTTTTSFSEEDFVIFHVIVTSFIYIYSNVMLWW